MQVLGEEYDHLFKVVVVGVSEVGKTQLISRIAKDSFSEEYKPTVGVDFRPFMLSTMNAKVQLWDLSGQQKYQSITSAYYKSAAVAIFVYSVTDANSFACIPKLAEDFKTKIANSPNVCLLIGNKADLSAELRKVTQAEAEALALKLGMLSCEISAKTEDREVILSKLKEALEKFQLISESS